LPSNRINCVSPSGVPPRLPPEPDHVPVSSELPLSAPLVLPVLVNVYFVHKDISALLSLGQLSRSPVCICGL
jgi:hypothetical protein